MNVQICAVFFMATQKNNRINMTEKKSRVQIPAEIYDSMALKKAAKITNSSIFLFFLIKKILNSNNVTTIYGKCLNFNSPNRRR